MENYEISCRIAMLGQLQEDLDHIKESYNSDLPRKEWKELFKAWKTNASFASRITGKQYYIQDGIVREAKEKR